MEKDFFSTQELQYSIDLDSSKETEHDESVEELDTQELQYSIDLDSDDSEQQSSSYTTCDSGSEESLPDIAMLKPYDFEPVIKDLTIEEDQTETNENIRVSRVGNNSWCLCGKCEAMESEAESLCCLDTNEVPEDYFEGNSNQCITNTVGFRDVCLSKNVLKTALSALNDLRGDTMTNVTNCAYRYAGYKQYTWWVHNYLGKGVRKVIPSCAVWAIRNKFASDDGVYVPFMESKEEERRILEDN